MENETVAEVETSETGGCEAPPVQAATAEVEKPAEAIPMIQIAPGVSIPLAQFQAAADPLCRFCSQGIVTRFDGKGKRVQSGCQCAARKLRREMRIAREKLQIPTAPSVHMEKDPALERARVETRLGILRARAEPIEASVAERTRGVGSALADAEAAVRVSDGLCGDGRLHVMDAETLLAVIKAKAAEEIAAQEAVLVEERALLEAQEKANGQTKAVLAEAQAKQARVLRDTEGARKRAENLRRRIAGIEARHADVLSEKEGATNGKP